MSPCLMVSYEVSYKLALWNNCLVLVKFWMGLAHFEINFIEK